MVISNWVERKLEERRIKREKALIAMGRKEGREEGHEAGIEAGIEMGRKEGFEQGRAYERKRIVSEAKDDDLNAPPSLDDSDDT